MTGLDCPPLIFRSGVRLEDPVRLGLLFLEKDFSYRVYDSVSVPLDASLTETDLRFANKILARMSAREIAALLERKEAFDSALERVDPTISLADANHEIPWEALHDLYMAASGVRGVGLAKLTKALHKKRPLLIPMLDSVVAGYLRSVDTEVPVGGVETAEALTRSYKRELDANRTALECIQSRFDERGYSLSLCRILDLYTWSYAGDITPAWASAAISNQGERLALDVGITRDPGGATDRILDAAVRELGYAGARAEVLRWLERR